MSKGAGDWKARDSEQDRGRGTEEAGGFGVGTKGVWEAEVGGLGTETQGEGLEGLGIGGQGLWEEVWRGRDSE